MGASRRAAGLISAAVLALATAAATGVPAHADDRSASVRAPNEMPNGMSPWERVPLPPLRGQTDLVDLAAVGPNDVWAVGYVRSSWGVETLVLRWDGKRWKRVPSPNPSDDQNWLLAVDGTSAKDVWAVGYELDEDRRHRMLVLHWNGARWRVVPTPGVGEELESTLVDVEALSPTDVWAVGTATGWPLTGRTLTLHWDGQRWTRVESPNPSTEGLGSNLVGVAASSADEVWAVGDYDPSGTFGMQPLAERWDGASWSVVPTPAVPEDAMLGSLGIAAADDVWAVGYRTVDGLPQPLAERWDGESWRAVKTPVFDGVEATFNDVVVRGRDDVWVIGTKGRGTLIAHWDGSSWTLVPGVEPGQFVTSIAAATEEPGTGCLWAVGQFTDGERAEAFVERSCPS